MQQASVLDFEVHKENLTTAGGLLVPRKCALVRNDNDAVLGIVGKKFGIIQNNDLFPAIDAEVFSSLPAEAKENAVISDSVAFNGSVCYRHYKFPTIKPDEGQTLRARDSVTDLGFMLTIANGFGGSSLAISSGAIDFYCDNGIISGKMDAHYTRRHSADINIHGLTPAVTAAVASFENDTIKWARWMKKQVSDGTVSDFLENVVSPGLGKKLMSQWFVEKEARGANVWAVYSALTNYASHTSDGRFAVRNTGADHEAFTRMGRHQRVAKIAESDEFLALTA